MTRAPKRKPSNSVRISATKTLDTKASIDAVAGNDVRSAWQRTGAFIGTAATVVAVTRIARPNKAPAVVDAFAKSFSNSLGAAMGKDMSVAEYQKGGASVIDVNVQTPSVWAQGYERANELYPHLRSKPVPYFWRGIYYRVLSLFPQVTTPYEVDWIGWTERVFDIKWDGTAYEYFGRLMGELRENYESG